MCVYIKSFQIISHINHENDSSSKSVRKPDAGYKHVKNNNIYTMYILAAVCMLAQHTYLPLGIVNPQFELKVLTLKTRPCMTARKIFSSKLV